MKEWAIQTFGTADKLVLTVLVLAVIAVIAAVAGSMERPRVPIGSAAIVLAGVAGCARCCPAAGIAVGHRPHRRRHGVRCRSAARADLRTVQRRAATTDPDESDEPDHGRRLSLVTLGLITAGALTGVVGVVLSRARTSVRR